MTNPDKRKPREWKRVTTIGYLNAQDRERFDRPNPLLIVREVIPGEVTLTLDQVMPLVDAVKEFVGFVCNSDYCTHPACNCHIDAKKALAQFEQLVKERK